jgi:acetylornithine/succinyldiaminopimelate/putrescine aminotransferase
MGTRINHVMHRGYEDFRDFVNPLIFLRTELSGEPWRMAKTNEGRLVDHLGKFVEDLHGTQAFGHRHPAITKAVMDVLESDSPNWFPSRVSPYAGTLARRLCERTNMAYQRAFFASSGSEAVESALKLARAVTRKPRILSLERAYHGCTFGSCALMSPGVFRDPFAPHLPGVESIPINDIEALEKALAPADVAAIVVEPIQLEGGVRILSPEYIDALCSLSQKHGALLVADEVQTGLGRTGQFLASDTWPRRPDAVLLAKHLGGGLLPISTMLTRKDLWEQAYGADFETSEAHNCTFSGSALVCAAANAALDLLTDDVIERVRRDGHAFRTLLRDKLQGLPGFVNVRGAGFVVGIELSPAKNPWLNFEHFGMEQLAHHPTSGLLLCHRLYKRGFFCFVCGHDWSTLRLQPRFNIPWETLESLADTVREELISLGELD